jgi:site-specific DNA-cytosine methylase
VPRRQAVSLFTGAGGFDEGIELAGFGVALALEIDRHARATYRANFPGVPVVPGDIHDFMGPQEARHRELYGLARSTWSSAAHRAQGSARLAGATRSTHEMNSTVSTRALLRKSSRKCL